MVNMGKHTTSNFFEVVSLTILNQTSEEIHSWITAIDKLTTSDKKSNID